MIRMIITIITFLSFAGVLDAECVLTTPLESSSHVRISVVLGGKPLKGAKVILRRPSQLECVCGTDMLRGNPIDTTVIPSSASQMTDENGNANLPELTPGEYDVAVTLNDVASTAFVGLHVTSSPKVTTIPIDLTQLVQRVEEVPILFHVEAFRGTVKDFSGATLPGARIVVVKSGSQAKGFGVSERSRYKWEFFGSISRGLLYRGLFPPRISPSHRPIRSSKRRRQPAFS